MTRGLPSACALGHELWRQQRNGRKRVTRDMPRVAIIRCHSRTPAPIPSPRSPHVPEAAWSSVTAKSSVTVPSSATPHERGSIGANRPMSAPCSQERGHCLRTSGLHAENIPRRNPKVRWPDAHGIIPKCASGFLSAFLPSLHRPACGFILPPRRYFETQHHHTLQYHTLQHYNQRLPGTSRPPKTGVDLKYLMTSSAPTQKITPK